MHFISDMLRRMSAGMQRFFLGRYGHDKLNLAILILGLVFCILGMFTRNWLLNTVCSLISYGTLILTMYRCLSRKTYKRYQENRRFLLLLDTLKDRSNRYYSCPKCHQTVRVPKGKGKIAITCPKCREKFIKRT